MAFGDLTTLSDVKTWLQTGQNAFPITDDALLSRLVRSASEYIQTWLNRQIALADYSEVRDGTGGETLQFACFPVSNVLSLTIDGRAVPRALSSWTAGYNYNSTQLSVRGYRFNRGVQNVAVTYTGGYTTTPADIAQACIELVALRYRERTRIGEVSKSLGGAETITYSQKDLSDSVKTLLQQYRSVIPVTGVRPIAASAGADVAIFAGVL
jgi:Phage gp6-like head-tail connector protein